MSITSYAQNFEDVMLWRALGHIERGFYIDIGAQEPVIDSVSLAFHERGWQGIHVEPLPRYAELLRQQRLGDTVIQAAVGNGPAVLKFFEVHDTGLSTADPTIAAQHRESGFSVHEVTVPCIPLSSIFDACTEPEIHWLKIDVEGFEQQALLTWGGSSARPWIVIIESTLPRTQIETHETWEPILIDYGYTPVYFDGLNRYYVSKAHQELTNAFRIPPNVFDGFALNGTASASFHRLIESRYQKQISEASAQSALEKQSSNIEIDRLALSITSLNKKHAEQIRITRQEMEGLLRNQEQREQELNMQLLTMQRQIDQEKTELVSSCNEKIIILQREYSEKMYVITQELHTKQEAFRCLEQGWDRLKMELDNKIAVQQSEAQLLKHEHQLQMQQHDAELRVKLDEHNHLMEVHTALEAQLNAQILSEQKANLQLENLLTEVQRQLKATHSALSWRLTVPFRAIASMIAFNKKSKEQQHLTRSLHE
jgi:FkbM family methyltransferase